MADIGTTDIDIRDVRNTLSEVTYNLFDLGTSSNINMWSRYKPVRDAYLGVNWPLSSMTYGSGRYGLAFGRGTCISTDGVGTEMDLTNWTYQQPRGGSQGGLIDEPIRLGDFRGYSHTPSNTNSRPVVGVDTANAPSGTYYVYAGDTVSWSTVTCSNNTLGIVPDDMILNTDGDTMGDYFLAVYLTDGADTKWLSSVTDVNGGSSVIIDLTDDPYASWSGEITWEVVICDIASIDEDAWNAGDVQDANYCSLPTGEYGGKTYVNTGTFIINNNINEIFDFQVQGCSVLDDTTEVIGNAQMKTKIGRSVIIPANNLSLKSNPSYDPGDTENNCDGTPVPVIDNSINIAVEKTIGTAWTTIHSYVTQTHFNPGGIYEGIEVVFTAYQKCYYDGVEITIDDGDGGYGGCSVTLHEAGAC